MKRILFQGDSITDAHRSRDNDFFAGNGYPTLLAGYLGYKYPGEYECLNRGISGDRIVDLFSRVKADFIHLKPDVISILIGINDVWHEITRQNGVDAGKFALVYELLLSELKEALPDVRFVLMEPFVLPGRGTVSDEENPGRFETFTREVKLRQEAVRRLAEKTQSVFVPLQKPLDDACLKAAPSHWLIDGVHPTAAGHALIADEWLKAMGL